MTARLRQRVRRSTTTLPNGTRVTTQKLVTLPELEWRLQAQSVRELKAMPEYAETAERVVNGQGLFTLAGDMNGNFRSSQEAIKATATGIAAGDPDLRIYAAVGRLLLIEYKNARGYLSADQRARHALLRALGYTVEVVKAATPDEAAAATIALVSRWLGLARSVEAA